MAIAPFARRRAHLMFVLAALALCLAAKILWRIDALGFAVLFLSGMTVACKRSANDTLASLKTTC